MIWIAGTRLSDTRAILGRRTSGELWWLAKHFRGANHFAQVTLRSTHEPVAVGQLVLLHTQGVHTTLDELRREFRTVK